MPWDCTCGARVDRDDETTCPTCGQQKGAWTLVADKTRTLSVTTRKAPLYRGDGDDVGGPRLEVLVADRAEEARPLGS